MNLWPMKFLSASTALVSPCPPRRRACLRSAGSLSLEGCDCAQPAMMSSQFHGAGAASATTHQRSSGKAAEILTECGLRISPRGIAGLTVDQAVFRDRLASKLDGHDENAVISLVDALDNELFDDDDCLKSCLLPLKVINGSNQTSSMGSAYTENSLIRVLLRVDSLQMELVSRLMMKLPKYMDHVQEGDDLAGNYARLIMNQFRFLEHVVQPEQMWNDVSNMLGAVPAIHIQKEIISCIPEIILESEHKAVAETMMELMRTQADLLLPIIDILGSLQVDQEMRDDHRKTMIRQLDKMELEVIPVVLKFLHSSSDSPAAADNLVKDIRKHLKFEDIGVVLKNKAVFDSKGKKPAFSQAVILDAFKVGLLNASSHLRDAWFKVIEEIDRADKHVSLDILILIITLSFDRKTRKEAERIFKSKTASGLFSSKQIQDTIENHAEGLQMYRTALLELPSMLLRTNNSANVSLAEAVYCSTFHVFDHMYRQEVIATLVTNVGSGIESEIDATFQVLVKLVELYPKEVAEFAIFVKSLLESLETLSENQVRLLFEAYSGLATESKTVNVDDRMVTGESSLLSDMYIIMKKQLALNTERHKRVGIFCALALVQRLGAHLEGPATSVEPTGRLDDTGIKQAIDVLTLVLQSCKDSMSCLGLAFHELAFLVSNKKLDLAIVDFLFNNVCGSLVPMFIMHDLQDDVDMDENVPFKLWMDIEEENVGLAIYPRVRGDLPLERVEAIDNRADRLLNVAIANPHMIVILAPLFKLTQSIEYSLNSNRDGIASLMKVGLLMPGERDEKTLSLGGTNQRKQTYSAVFYAICWLRELLNAFTSGADQETIQNCVTRIQHIQELEGYFSEVFKTFNSFTPSCFNSDREDENKTVEWTTAGSSFEFSSPIRASQFDGSQSQNQTQKSVAASSRLSGASSSKRKAPTDDEEESEEGGDTEDEELAKVKTEGDGDAPPSAKVGKYCKRKAANARSGKKSEGAKTPTKARAAGKTSGMKPRKVKKQKTIANDAVVFTSMHDARTHFRELEMGVFDLLRLNETQADEDVLKYPALQYLLQELSRKVGFMLPLPQKQPKSGKADSRSIGGSGLVKAKDAGCDLLARMKLKDFIRCMIDLVPSLCFTLDRLMDAVGERRTQREREDEERNRERESIILCLQLTLKCFHYLVSFPEMAQQPHVSNFFKAVISRDEGPPNNLIAMVQRAHAYFVRLAENVPTIEIGVLLLKVTEGLAAMAVDPTDDAWKQLIRPVGDVAAGFLKLEWEDRNAMKSEGLVYLLRRSIASSEDPSEALYSYAFEAFDALYAKVVEEDEVDKAALTLIRYPFLTKETAISFYKVVLDELNNLLQSTFNAHDVEDRFEIFSKSVQIFGRIVQSLKSTSLKNERSILSVVMKESKNFISSFNKHAMTMFTEEFKQYHARIVVILAEMQKPTRTLQALCNDAKMNQDRSFLAVAPALRKALETLLEKTKHMMKLNKSRGAFVLGNLKHKNLAGQVVSSQMTFQRDDSEDSDEEGGTTKRKRKGKSKTSSGDDENSSGRLLASSKRKEDVEEGDNEDVEDQETEKDDEDGVPSGAINASSKSRSRSSTGSNHRIRARSRLVFNEAMEDEEQVEGLERDELEEPGPQSSTVPREINMDSESEAEDGEQEEATDASPDPKVDYDSESEEIQGGLHENAYDSLQCPWVKKEDDGEDEAGYHSEEVL
ncbi:hypothetical protein SeMB42_g03598 [Synchytrium endobioticum]|uniref:Fanconi anemia group D2 protein n=1 Tax=Synchytrium endobioticum TaxID=286115 RepID=A0A507D5D4_9FUNG|nr:hypothetical protein SeMB42_g03598 [Synchytrium endobioticum]